ncbi:hypothetical protein B0A49_03018 [Cryomyces minteri]|uniref:alpha-1,2-Mannosidase n=1 Tax=Cryomyces minteri TaxID=331657 RepID=A0A4U0XBI0_9PEZI|nr:hypothetical protein B0A49_03018 [Cryomyces minteri]
MARLKRGHYRARNRFGSSESLDSNGRFRWSSVPVHFPPGSITPLPSGKPLRLPKVQHTFEPESTEEAVLRQSRRDQVKTAFERCWTAYREHAWMKDEVAPLSGGYRNGFGGWAATLIDNLDTLWIMEMKDEFEVAVSAAVNVDLGVSTLQTVNVFETTIRHLGGLLAAYDLSGDRRLLDKAGEVGDMLYVAFDTPNRMPITRWDFQNGAKGVPQIGDDFILVAEIGSLTMEFTRLSQLTRDPKWYDAVGRIVDIFNQQQNQTQLPGMWPVVVNAQEANLTRENSFGLGAMSDSLYEYFPKMHALLGGLDSVYEKLYRGAMAAAVQHVLWRPMTPNNADILISGDVRMRSPSVSELDPQGQHLVCFAGGMFALGSRLFDIPAHMDIAHKLVDGCMWTYKAFPLGIMPETFHMVPCPSKSGCQWDEAKWKAEAKARSVPATNQDAMQVVEQLRLPPGFTAVGDRRYILRPEAIESVFILYRITGRKDLLDTAWDMFSAIRKYTETDLANAAIADVTVTDGKPPKLDSMESFWLAETLKYFYLLFSDLGTVSLDEYVFNTEAHPFKRPA